MIKKWRNGNAPDIPKENIQIHSRSVIIRLDSAGVPEDLRDDDFEKAKAYLHRMSHNNKTH